MSAFQHLVKLIFFKCFAVSRRHIHGSLLGLLVDWFIYRLFGFTISNIYVLMVLGMIFAAVYAETFSFFYRVGRVAFVGLLLICTLDSRVNNNNEVSA